MHVEGEIAKVPSRPYVYTHGSDVVGVNPIPGKVVSIVPHHKAGDCASPRRLRLSFFMRVPVSDSVSSSPAAMLV